MGKKVKEFKAGDFIFAKVKGYPAWPARVQGIKGKKYFVFFYGTREIANLPPNMIFDYAENKDKFLTKTVKRKDFNDGVKQIEHDFTNNVPLEDVVGTVPAYEKASAEASLNDTDMNDTANDTVNTTNDAGDETMDLDETAEKPVSNDKPTDESDDAGPLVIDEGKKNVKRKAPVAKEAKTPKTPRRAAKKDDLEEKKEEEKKDEEVISRSGRKIKPKRYIDEEVDELVSPSPVPKKRRGATPEKVPEKVPEKASEKTPEKVPEKQKSVEPVNVVTPSSSTTEVETVTKIYNAVPQIEIEDLQAPFKNEKTDNILIARLPSGQFVGVKLFQKRPSMFKTDQDRLQWEKQSAKNSILLKNDLEKGITTPQSVGSQIEMDLKLTDDEKVGLEKERAFDDTKMRVKFLKVEVKLIELEAKIKACLSLEKADTEQCLKLIDDLLAMDVKPLMFLKQSSVLETIKRMRCYIGNTPSWDLSEEEAVNFSKQAQLIRKKADVAYATFKNLFSVPHGYSFWDYYLEQVNEFRRVTANYSSEELIELIVTPPLTHSRTRKSTGGDDVPRKKSKSSAGKEDKDKDSQSKKTADDNQNVEMATEQTENNEDTVQNEVETPKENDATRIEPDAIINDVDSTAKATEPIANDINMDTEETSGKELSDKNANEIEKVPQMGASENIGTELDKDADKDVEKVTEENEKETSVSNEGANNIGEELSDTIEKIDISSKEKEVVGAENESNKSQVESSKNELESDKLEKESSKKESSKTDKSSTKRSPRRSLDRDAKKEDGSESGRESSTEPKTKRSRETTKKPEPPQLKTPTKRKSRS